MTVRKATGDIKIKKKKAIKAKRAVAALETDIESEHPFQFKQNKSSTKKAALAAFKKGGASSLYVNDGGRDGTMNMTAHTGMVRHQANQKNSTPHQLKQSYIIEGPREGMAAQKIRLNSQNLGKSSQANITCSKAQHIANKQEAPLNLS